jgi:hypothetical protein
MMKIKALIVWRRCKNFPEWAIERIFTLDGDTIDNKISKRKEITKLKDKARSYIATQLIRQNEWVEAFRLEYKFGWGELTIKNKINESYDHNNIKKKITKIPHKSWYFKSNENDKTKKNLAR